MIRPAALILLALLVCTGATCGRTRPGPVPESCEAICRTPCDTAIPVWLVDDPNDPGAWDSYPEQVTIPLQTKAKACDLHRTACVQCLDRLKAAGVTR